MQAQTLLYNTPTWNILTWLQVLDFWSSNLAPAPRDS